MKSNYEDENKSLLQDMTPDNEEEQLEDINLNTAPLRPTNFPSAFTVPAPYSNQVSHPNQQNFLVTSPPRSFYLGGGGSNEQPSNPEAILPTVQPSPQSSLLPPEDASSLSQGSYFSTEQNVKYISPPAGGAFVYFPGGQNHPFGGNGEDEEENIIHSLQQRSSSLFLNRIVSYTITFALLMAFILVIVLYVNFQSNGNGGNNQPDTCYESPSCPNEFISPQYDLSTGFTNFTGWQNSQMTNQCCNICPPVMAFTTDSTREHVTYRGVVAKYGSSNYHYLRPEAERSVKARRALFQSGDVNFDYLVFDQIWLPQFCYALELGHDPTLSHLVSDRCKQYIYDSFSPQLVIHGLWPNKLIDSLICCLGASATSVPTLNLAEIQTWAFYNELTLQWFDPTITGTYYNNSLQLEINCSYCYLLNHEWQKHGSCFGFSLEDSNQKQYFESGLILAEMILNKTQQINRLNGTVVPKTDLEALYSPYAVNVMCDPQDSNSFGLPDGLRDDSEIGVFLEIQTCWDLVLPTIDHRSRERVNADPIRSSNFTMIDCPSVRNSNYSSECPDQVFIRNFVLPDLVLF